MTPTTKWVLPSTAAILSLALFHQIYRRRKCKINQQFQSSSLVLVVDIGSSSIRCSAYGVLEQGGEWTYVGGSMQQCKNNSLDQSVLEILERVDQVIDRCMKFLRDKHLGDQVVAIGFSSFVMNFIGLDGSGKVITPILTYANNNNETSKYATKLREILLQDGNLDSVSDRTGTPIHSAYAPAQILCLSKTNPDLLSNVDLWTTLSSMIIATWTGEKTQPISYSEASWTGLFDFRSLEWNENLIKTLNISAQTLPKVVDSTKHFTSGLKSKYARRWPELTKVKLFYGIGDGAAANIGTKCLDQSRIALTIGTSAAIRVILPLKNFHSKKIPYGLWCYRISEESVLLGGALTDGGSIFQWVKSVFVVDDETMKSAAQLTPASHGLTVMPFLSGERSPGFSTRAKCCILGLTSSTRACDILRASLESVALRLCSIQSLMEPFFLDDPIVIASGEYVLCL